MSKYRGKYKKCRTCKNAIEVLMVLVEVNDDCPNGVQFSSAKMTSKEVCESCDDWSERK